MTITVGADTYLSLSDAYTYHQNKGNTTWTTYRKTITSIVTHADGISVTTLTDNGYSEGDRVSLYGTTNYNQVGEVKTIVSTKIFTLDISYVSDENSGFCVDEILEVCLRKATEWIDNHPDHKGNWKGYITSTLQLLSFPRSGLYDEEGRSFTTSEIPTVIESACAEMALKALSETIFPDIGAGSVGLKRRRIDVIEKEWFAPTLSTVRKKYDYVDNLISGLLNSNKGSVLLIKSY